MFARTNPRISTKRNQPAILIACVLGASWAASGPARAQIGPPPPTTIGTCCLGSQCSIVDQFDCRELGGFFQPGGVGCFPGTCNTGICCMPDTACLDTVAGGPPMDEVSCLNSGGDYLGGAVCDREDHCQRFRVPPGFEIVDVSWSVEGFHGPPRLNNCGQVAYSWRLGQAWATAEVFLYDNGKIEQVTENADRDVEPKVNDHGTIVWGRGSGSDGVRKMMIRFPGAQGAVFIAESPSLGAPDGPINNRNVVAWDARVLGVCPPRFDLFLTDETGPRVLFDDGASNQSASLNDSGVVTWPHKDFVSCTPDVNWVSDIRRYDGGVISVLPSALTQRNATRINNLGDIVWEGTLNPDNIRVVEFLSRAGVLVQVTNDFTGVPVINDRGRITYTGGGTGPSAEINNIRVLREGIRYFVSTTPDFRNVRPDINDDDEIAWWWWDPNFLTASGTRYLRRIRDGDVNFDGAVTLADFIPFPNCFTNGVKRDGLCECRFFDIDHDRDIDDDDFDLFLRVYTGPLDDCNTNGVSDLVELLHGEAADCDLDGVIDACALAANPTLDIDGDGLLDACCAPVAPSIPVTLTAANRYLSFTATPQVPVAMNRPAFALDPAEGGWPIDPPYLSTRRYRFQGTSAIPRHAIRVTFTSLPAPFNALNGSSMWVGPPGDVDERGGAVVPVAGFPTFSAATLQCSPHFDDWAAIGTVHVSHAAIVPSGVYSVQTVVEGCGQVGETNFSTPLLMTQSQWGDLVAPLDPETRIWPPPDDSVDVISDVLAILAKFSSGPSAPIKARADIAPATPDRVIDVVDIVGALNAFSGFPFPYTTVPTACP